MEIEEVFKSPFKMFLCRPLLDDSPVELPGLKVLYRTEEEITGPTTTEKIFNLSQVYLKQIIEEYNSYQFEECKPVIATYHLYIAWEVEKNELKVDGKELYYVVYNVEEEEKYIAKEKKNYLPPETIERNFFIFIDLTVYYRKIQPDPNLKNI